MLALLGRSLLATLAVFTTVTAFAHERSGTRIGRAVPINLAAADMPPEAALRGEAQPTRVRFEAYGRSFEMDLESNAGILRDLPAAQRDGLPPHTLYKGRLAGQQDSWLRLARVQDRLYGAIWDGADLYAIAPAQALAGLLDRPVAGGPGATLMYRAADVDTGFGSGSCAPAVPDSLPTAELQYTVLAQELSAPAILAAVGAIRELAVGLVADTQFNQRFVDPQGVMLSRLNTVDGIFSAQVGVSLVATDLQVLADNGRLTATSANTLLRQLSTLRSSTPALRSRGLTHLMTGRDLDGTTAGIAYVGGLCSNAYGASLSQQGADPWTGSLVAAHEIGHNFGAQHDGEPGTVCASTPRTFLMAPAISGIGTFSQCSLDTIATEVQSASCLAAAGVVDLGLEVPATVINAYARQTTIVAIDVVSLGNRDATSATVGISVDPALQLLGAAVADGDCTIVSSSVTCSLATVTTGARRRIELQLRGDAAGQFAIAASLSAPLDQTDTNNSASLSIALEAAADGSLALQPTALSSAQGEVQRVSAVLTTRGIDALTGVSVRIAVPTGTLSIERTTADQGTCTSSAGQVACDLGTVPAGSTRRVDLDVRGIRSAVTTIEASLTAGNDADPGNDRATASVTVVAAVSTGSRRSGGGAADGALLLALLALALNRASGLGRARGGNARTVCALPNRHPGRLR